MVCAVCILLMFIWVLKMAHFSLIGFLLSIILVCSCIEDVEALPHAVLMLSVISTVVHVFSLYPLKSGKKSCFSSLGNRHLLYCVEFTDDFFL